MVYKTYAVVAESLIERVRLAVDLARNLVNPGEDIIIVVADCDMGVGPVCRGLGYNLADTRNCEENDTAEIVIIRADDLPLIEALVGGGAMIVMGSCPTVVSTAKRRVIVVGESVDRLPKYDLLYCEDGSHVPCLSLSTTISGILLREIRSHELLMLLNKDYEGFCTSNIAGVSNCARAESPLILRDNKIMMTALADYAQHKLVHMLDRSQALEYLLERYRGLAGEGIGDILAVQFAPLARHLVDMDYSFGGRVVYGQENSGEVCGISVTGDVCHRMELDRHRVRIWRFRFGAISSSHHKWAHDGAVVNALVLSSIGFDIRSVAVLYHDGKCVQELAVQDIVRVRRNIEHMRDEIISDGLTVDLGLI